MTYNVFCGTLNLTQSNPVHQRYSIPIHEALLVVYIQDAALKVARGILCSFLSRSLEFQSEILHTCLCTLDTHTQVRRRTGTGQRCCSINCMAPTHFDTVGKAMPPNTFN